MIHPPSDLFGCQAKSEDFRVESAYKSLIDLSNCLSDLQIQFRRFCLINTEEYPAVADAGEPSRLLCVT